MRVVVAGATGVIGRQVVPLLVEGGHEVVALSRAPKAGRGVRGVAVDALDAAALGKAVREAMPDAVLHLLTAIPWQINPRKLERDFAVTNRLRTEATRTLAQAARDAGAGRFVVQGLAYGYDPAPGLADEDAPLWRNPPKEFAKALDALRTLERITTEEAGGLVLRFGHLYGPGTVFAADGSSAAAVRARKLPVAGDGGSTFSFTHTRDAADALVAALTRPQVRGVLNVVDDDPARLDAWLPALAEMLGAPKPRQVPAFLARLAAGSWGAAYLTRLRGAANSRAKQSLGWAPAHPSWRAGLAAELGAAADGVSSR
ncbi:NAD-dependent epimerase/dehydratase family protein [Actinacidiphila rubida]|uniref:Nucleoside-diphosphate-sugar epimerase n=1 Tax=Actinacidiphila rubida TaxID=310780 RepID=A0A1H8Q3E0_9ACTN|nr:NAD(P)-dependent oxidoreductase [Actinacidiphila rubida]SEO48729.1 Nucleoside-diphosphate-sugar epimerase [Actinacidiphila rubida]